MQGEFNHTKYTVAVRIRPSLTNTSQSIFSVHQNRYVKELRPKSIVTYSFDEVFEPEHDNHYIYDQSVKEKIQYFLHKKINTTLLAYGQTGSGKTHTLFGHNQSNPERERGLAQLILMEVVKEKLDKQPIYCSFMQIYKEKVTDLLSGAKINLRDNEKGDLVISEQTVIKVQSFEHIIQTLHKANSNKIFGHSYVHSESSRSHVMFTLTIGNTYLNIVDLCGCQVLTYKFDEKQRQQTNSINLSLFTLNTVISDLCDKDRKKFTPFRNSVLTRLLKPSLVNMNKTQIYLFCNIAPEENHRAFSVSTLKFGQIAISIDEAENVKEEKVNLSQQKRDAKKVSNIIDLNPKPLTHFLPIQKWKFITQEKILGNQILLYSHRNQQSSKINILFLHAYGAGCSGQDWDLFIPYINKNLNISANLYSVDFPGFANSSGKKFTSRAQNFGDKGESMQFMKQLFKIFKFSSSNPVFLIGYDLGGAIALSSAMHNNLKKAISGVVAFHPTWTSKIQNLALISLPVQLIWVPVQNFHLVSAGQKMSKAIKNCNLFRLNIGPYTQQKASGYYDSYCDTIGQLIAEFITTIEPPIQTISKRGKIEEQIIEFDLNKEEEELQRNKGAVKQFYDLIEKKKFREVFECLLKGGENKPKYVRLASEIPEISPAITFQKLIETGILPTGPIKNLSSDLPMFPSGRQIHINTTIELSTLEGPQKYLAYKKNGDRSITHRCRVSPHQSQDQILDQDKLKVKVEKIDGNKQEILVNLDEIVELNSETIFRIINNSTIFEDQVACKYSSLITKLMLMRCCHAIKDIIPTLDLQANTQETLTKQKQCSKRIFKTMDLRHLVKEGIDNTRYTGTDAGKLAYYGQGNCHHLASVLAALLLPFSSLLGWEVIFRGGSFFSQGRDIDENGNPLPKWNGKPNTNVQDHTWLQIVYKPSFKSFVMDPSFGICSQPLDTIYTFAGRMHISGKRQCHAKNPQFPTKIYQGHQALL